MHLSGLNSNQLSQWVPKSNLLIQHEIFARLSWMRACKSLKLLRKLISWVTTKKPSFIINTTVYESVSNQKSIAELFKCHRNCNNACEHYKHHQRFVVCHQVENMPFGKIVPKQMEQFYAAMEVYVRVIATFGQSYSPHLCTDYSPASQCWAILRL